MLNKLSAFLHRYGMLRPGDRVVCAVSGGADSMALLWAMYLLKDRLDFALSAAHFNHKLRGAESDRDETFVRQFCSHHGIPFAAGSAQVTAGQKGLEAAARDARYAFLKSLPGKIATAHTADDNAETVLMHMVRGTGLKGLGGIAPVSGVLIRPMLEITREEVLAFLRSHNVAYMEDSSNAGDDFLRNRLRHSVMPLLKGENPSFSPNVSAMALRLRQDEKVLEDAAEENMTRNISVLRTMAPAIRSRVLCRILLDTGVTELEMHHIEALEKLVFSEKPSAKTVFPGGVTVRRCYEELEVSCAEETLETRELICPGVTCLPELGLRITCKPNVPEQTTVTSYPVLPVGKLFVRSRIPGDAIRLSGGTKSLKKLFIDHKIPLWRRGLVPVLADDAGVLGVVGVGGNFDRFSDDANAIRIVIEYL